MLHKWIIMPLKELKPIQERLGMVEYLVKHDELLQEFLSHIKPIGDLERLISKVGLQKAGTRELVQLKRALTHIAKVKELADQTGNQFL